MKQTSDVAAFGFGGLKPVSRRTLRKWKARRRVAEGYPWDGAFATMAEINEYFSGDRIECLLCGRALRKLGLHLLRLHNMTPDDYKERYGIPWRRGLCSAPTRAAHAACGHEKNMTSPEHLTEARRMPHRPLAPAVLQQATERVLRNLGLNKQHDASQAEEFLRRVKAGRSPRDVFVDKDMPKRSWMQEWRRGHPKFDKAFREAVDNLSFDVQASFEGLGPRFETELRKLFDHGMSDAEAARVLGVTAMTCNNRTKAWRKETAHV